MATIVIETNKKTDLFKIKTFLCNFKSIVHIKVLKNKRKQVIRDNNTQIAMKCTSDKAIAKFLANEPEGSLF